jgi:hypothetical protein
VRQLLHRQTPLLLRTQRQLVLLPLLLLLLLLLVRQAPKASA